MSLEKLLAAASVGWLLSYGLKILSDSIANTRLDITNLKIRKKYHLESWKRNRKSKRPLVTVLIYAFGSQRDLEGTLNSVMKNRYKNKEILIVTEPSKNGIVLATKQILSKKAKSKNIKLHNRRTVPVTAADLFKSVQKKVKGDIVMPVEAGYVMESQTINNISRIFSEAGDISLIRFKTISVFESTILDIQRSFDEMNKHQSAFQTGYRKNAFKLAAQNKLPPTDVKNSKSLIYESRIRLINKSASNGKSDFKSIYEQASRRSFKKIDDVLSFTYDIFYVAIISYFAYLAIETQYLLPFLLGWLLVSVSLLLRITRSAHTTQEKLHYLIFIPLVFVLEFIRKLILAVLSIYVLTIRLVTRVISKLK